jgi:thioredoxin-like negative regulator of GroEL
MSPSAAKIALLERLREVMVAIFEELGQHDPVSENYRRRLATTLY